MKKLVTFLGIVLLSVQLVAQAPQAFKYQAVVRNSTGKILPNKVISLQISIHDGSASGTIVYQETYDTTTNQFGLVNLEIGNGIPAIGSFSTINWELGFKFLEIGIDTTGGSNYTSMGTTQLVSVPYALHAGSSADAHWEQNGSDIYYNNGHVGIGTSTPIAPIDIRGSHTDDGVWLQIGNSDESHQLKIFGGREFDPNPFIFWKGTDPLRFATDLNGWTEHMRISSNGNIGMGTLDPTAKLHVQDTNGVLCSGTFGSGTIPVEGAGTRLMWYPGKGAFRVGYVDGSWWDDTNIGDNSMAMGFNTTASGLRSTAIGSWSSAEGEIAVAIGEGSEASGNGSVAIGFLADANGYVSTAIGANTEASGSNSFAIGAATTATGETATAMGFGTTAQSYRSFVVGSRNITSGTTDSWVETDPIFVIGNGLYPAFSNAMTVLKNGNVGIGTTNPASKLEINGSVTASSFYGNGSGLTGIMGDNLGNHVATQNLSLGDYNLTGNPTDGSVVIDANGELWFSPLSNPRLIVEGLATMEAAEVFSGTSSSWFINQNTDGSLEFSQTNYFYPVVFEDATGYVGIGTTNPSHLLHLYGYTNPRILVEAPATQTPELNLQRGSTTHALYVNGNNDLVFYRAGDRMTITDDGKVGIGTINPTASFHVQSTLQHAGHFTTNYNDFYTHVLHAEYTGTPVDAKGIYGECAPADYYGYGGDFVGGYQGVYGTVYATGSNTYYGVNGNASGGSGTNYAIYGSASGAGTNYAGYFAGNVTVTGTFTNPSDQKLKKSIQPFTNALSKINQINVNTYEFKTGGQFKYMNLPEGSQIGFTAQEMVRIIPELVTEQVHAYDINQGIKDAEKDLQIVHYKGINYVGMIPVLTQAIKEQQAIIEDLKTRLEKLENK